MNRTPTTLRKFGSKQMIEMSNTDGSKKLMFSYTTPVVVFSGGEYFITSEKFSTTTTRQINFYLRQENHPAARKPNYLNPDLFHTLVKSLGFM